MGDSDDELSKHLDKRSSGLVIYPEAMKDGKNHRAGDVGVGGEMFALLDEHGGPLEKHFGGMRLTREGEMASLGFGPGRNKAFRFGIVRSGVNPSSESGFPSSKLTRLHDRLLAKCSPVVGELKKHHLTREGEIDLRGMLVGVEDPHDFRAPGGLGELGCTLQVGWPPLDLDSVPNTSWPVVGVNCPFIGSGELVNRLGLDINPGNDSGRTQFLKRLTDRLGDSLMQALGDVKTAFAMEEPSKRDFGKYPIGVTFNFGFMPGSTSPDRGLLVSFFAEHKNVQNLEYTGQYLV